MTRTYTDDELSDLIACPKVITNPPHREMRLDGQHWRNEMDLVASDDKALTFHVFMRRNDNIPENFSIGLDFRHVEERDTICLLRCNGPHGRYLGQRDPAHIRRHIHYARAENIEAGARAERGGVETDEYSSYEDALAYFLQQTGIEHAEEYFPAHRQPPLFELGDTDEIKP